MSQPPAQRPARVNPPELMQAAELHRAGRLDEAIGLYRRALRAAPNHPDVLHLLGLALAMSGRPEQGAPMIENAIRLLPLSPAYHNNLGEARRLLGRLPEAIEAYRRAIELKADFPEPHFNLGNVLRATGRHDEAIRSYQRAIELNPAYAAAIYNLANAQFEQGRTAQAVENYRRVIGLAPDWREPRVNLGNALMEFRDAQAAIEQFEAAQRIGPANADIEVNIATARFAIGEVDQALESFRKAIAMDPQRRPLSELRLAGLAKPIPPDERYIDDYRAGVMAKLDGLIAEDARVDCNRLTREGAEPSFVLNYQGRDERPLRQRYADLFATRIPRFDAPGSGASPGRRPRVGVVVTPGHEGVFNHCMGALLQKIDPESMDLAIVGPLSAVNRVNTLFRNPDMQYLVVPGNVEAAAPFIARARFDLLHFWEVGSDSFNYFLPYFRCAPVQTTGWGWPVTTCIPTVQHFLSSALLETPGADAHYSEKLVRFESLPTYYLRPPVPAQRTPRGKLNLPGGRLYLCTQNLRKIHPEFDAMVAGLLERDPGGWFLVIADKLPALTRDLRQRLARSLGPKLFERVAVVPWMTREGYLDLISNADVILDTLHFGGGANTMADAYATGVPVVTLPTPHCRGRYALAAHTRCGLPEMIAPSKEAWVELALRIACDAEYRRHLNERIVAAAPTLFEDLAAVREHQAFFRAAATGAWKPAP